MAITGMNIRDCIPKDKVNTRAVARAAALGFPALNPILPDLAPSLKSVFAGDDLRRFAECPTPEQKLEELDEIALETLLAHRI